MFPPYLDFLQYLEQMEQDIFAANQSRLYIFNQFLLLSE